MPLSSKSSLTLSIHLLLCLHLLLSPLTCPCSAAFGSLFPSILSTSPNHLSLLLLIFPITVSSVPSSFFVFSFLILSLLLLHLFLINHTSCIHKLYTGTSFTQLSHCWTINQMSSTVHRLKYTHWPEPHSAIQPEQLIDQ